MAEIRIDFRSNGGAQTLKTLDAIATGAQKGATGVEALARAFNELQRSRGAADGLSKSFKDLTGAASQAASQVNKVTAPRTDTKGILALSKAFQVTYTEAQKLVQQLGLSGNVSAQAGQRFLELRKAGASTLQTYEVLSREFGLNAAQLKALNKAYQDFAVKQAVAAKSTQQFAQAQQKPYADASKAIADLTLQVGKAQAALAKGGAQQQISKENALFAEQLRYKQQLQKISNAGFSPQDAANAKALADQLNKLNIQKLDQDFNKLSTNARAGLGILAGAAAAAAGAIGTLFVEGVRQFTEFDNAIRQAGVISGGTAEDIGVLRDEVTRLGIVTSKTPAEIARTSVELARAGFSATEAAAALEGIVRASEATGESLQAVGDIVAKTLRVYNLSARESGRVADLLVETANSTNASIVGLGESLKFVGPAAAGSNQSLEDTLILLGLLGDAGIQGTSAGTGLAEALQRLKTASAGVDTQFSGLVRGQKGATQAFAAINTAVRNTDGSMKSVLEVIPEIKKQLAGFTREDQDILTKALFGTQGGRVFQTLINASPERIAKVTQEIKNSQGAARESGEALLLGLGGAFKVLEGSVSTALIQFGRFSAIALEPLVRLATNVINVFLRFPPSIQNIIIGLTGLGSAILAATALTLAYQAANGNLIKQQIIEAAILVRNTALTAVSTKAKQAAALAETLFAVATGRANAAQQAQAGAIAANLARYGLLAAAVGSVALAFEALQSSERANKGLIADVEAAEEATNKLRNSLVVLDEQIEGTRSIDEVIAGNLDALTEDINPVLKFIDRIREGLDSLPEPLQTLLRAFNPIIEILDSTTTETERAVDRQSQEFGKLTESAEKTLNTFDELASSENGLADATSTELDNLAGSLDAQIAAFENSTPAVGENIAARERYLNILRANRKATQEAIDATKAQDAAEGDTTAINERTEAIKKAVEERQKLAREAQDDQRADDERALSRQLDDERQARQEANQEELAAQQKEDAEEVAELEKTNAAEVAEIEKQNAAEIADFEKQQQAQLQEVERQGAEAIAAFESEEQAKLQDREQRFQRNQQQEAANFAANQRRIEEEFQQRLSDRTQAQDESFTNAERLIALRGAQDTEERRTIQEQARVAREIQNLNLADQILSPERLAQLAQTISGVGTIDNEEEAQRAQETLGLIRQEQQRQQQEADRQAELALQAQLQAQEAAFQKQQQGEELAFQGTLNEERSRLEAEVEARRLAFETDVLTPLRTQQEGAIAQLREQQEIALTAIREQQERDVQAVREQQEAEIEARRSAFEDEERRLDRQFEDEKIARDRAYREEQRRLDRENAIEIEGILRGARDEQGRDISFTPVPGLRTGGPMRAGQPYMVGEEGPELVVPRRNGYVIPAGQTANIARYAAMAQSIRMPSLANLKGSTGAIATTTAANREMTALRQEVKALRRTLQQRPAPQVQLSQNFAQDTPQNRRAAGDDAYYWMRKSF